VSGCLALVGGGEFSFGETEEADRFWLERTPPGPVAFVPAASGSIDYGKHFSDYLRRAFGREVEIVPIYRQRDGRRLRNAERLESCAAVYLGAGVADHLVEALAGTVAHDALIAKIAAGGVVTAIGAAAAACGAWYRGLSGGQPQPGLALLPDLAVEPNFDPGHDRRLRSLLGASRSLRGIGIPAGSALLVGPAGEFEAVGDVFALAGADADVVPLLGEEVS